MNLAEVVYGVWTIRQSYSFLPSADAFYAEHEHYDGSNAYPVFYGPSPDEVLTQCIEWDREHAE